MFKNPTGRISSFQPTSPVWTGSIANASILLVALCVFTAAVLSWRWPLVHDAAIMHYVAFLMDRGMRPYADIIDLNMPGSYMTDWLVIHTFGPGSLGLRIFDLCTVAVFCAAASVIASPVDWRAGLLGAFTESLIHIANGPHDVGQRDWNLMVLLVLGYACLFLSVRRHRAVYMFGFALLLGLAASIKPFVIPLPFLLLGVACAVLRKRGLRIRSYVAAALCGAALASILVISFLVFTHSLKAFFTTVAGLVPFYASVGNQPMMMMLRFAAPHAALLVLVLSAALYFGGTKGLDWESLALLLAIASGFVLFIAQRKGWYYHRATLLGFLLVWISIQFFSMIQRDGWERRVGILGVLVLCGTSIFQAWRVRSAGLDPAVVAEITEMTNIRADLRAEGGSGLNGSVQCFDMTAGCTNALYRMRLVPSTGLIPDFFLFTGQTAPMIEGLRSRLLAEMEEKPPYLIILTAQVWPENEYAYDELGRWPAFDTFLTKQYFLVKDARESDGSIGATSYRIYKSR